MSEFESKLRVSAAWLWTGSGVREPGVRSQNAAQALGSSYTPPRVAKVLAAISSAASSGQLSDADLDLLHSVVDRLQTRAAGALDVSTLPHLTPEQVRLDDLYRQAGALAPAQIMTLAKQLQAEAQRRSGTSQGKGKKHGREAGTG